MRTINSSVKFTTTCGNVFKISITSLPARNNLKTCLYTNSSQVSLLQGRWVAMGWRMGLCLQTYTTNINKNVYKHFQ